MPRNEKIISVFVASPGDVKDERQALEGIITELNKIWSRTLNLRLELLRWETDTAPGFGEYPQDVINKQINDDYDIFIAIFWSRFGTPTKEASSGTIEEFERAYKRFSENNEDIDLMVYFKDQPIPPSQIDPDQISKIQEFRKGLNDKGGYYFSFENLESFEAAARTHLSKAAQKWANISPEADAGLNIRASEVTAKLRDSGNDESDYGYFDYLDIYNSNMDANSTAVEAVSAATITYAEQLTRRTKEIHDSNSLEEDAKIAKARKIFKLSSDDMHRYSDTVEYQAKILKESRITAFDALSKAISLTFEVNEELEHSELRASLESLAQSITEALNGATSFRDTFDKMPRLISELNRAKRRARDATDNVILELRETQGSVYQVLKILNREPLN